MLYPPPAGFYTQVSAASASAGTIEFVQLLRDHRSLNDAVREWSDCVRSIVVEGMASAETPLLDSRAHDLASGTLLVICSQP